MEITKQELAWLNFYRVSELQGGLVLGAMVGRAREPELQLELTRHSAEEVMHSQLWAETIIRVGGQPLPMRDSYQRRYAAALGAPSTMLQVLTLTQVFERRVYKHFLAHLRRPGTHPAICATLERMLEEEKGHLSWVKHWLDARADCDVVVATMRRYARVDAEIYRTVTREYGWCRAA